MRSRPLVLAGLWIGILASVATTQDPAGPEPCIDFGLPRAIVWVARGCLLAFELDAPAPQDLELEAQVEGDALRIVEPPRVLAGRTTGYVRLRGCSEGAARLRVAGVALPIEVRRLPVEAAIDRASPRITLPVEGAVAWGNFAVAVEVSTGPDEGTDADRQIVLELPDGSTLAPSEVGGPGEAGERALFVVDAERIEPGPQSLRALVLQAGFEVGSAQRRLVIAHPAPERIARGECEASIEAVRPKGFGGGRLHEGSDPAASDGRFVACPRSDPQWILPFTAPESGLYQLLLRARGDRAAGAFPSVALAIDRPNELAGSTRLASTRWHRVPVGPPARLEAGEHVLALRFLNELSVGGRSDRNLYLDAWEIVRVGDQATDPARKAEAAQMGTTGADSGLWVGFERPIDGLPMNGRLELVAACSWVGADRPVPRVRLCVDDRMVSEQQAAKPTFALDRAHLRAGDHRIRLEAELPDGRRARTTEQVLHVPGEVGAETPRDFLRFSVLDERWSGLEPILDGRNEETRQRVARPSERVQASLSLPAELEGAYELLVEARGPGADAGARIGLTLRSETESRALDGCAVSGWWQFRPAGRVELAPGAKSLDVALEPDAGGGLRLRGLVLQRPRDEADRRPPVVEVLYPRQGACVQGVDAVVARAYDDDRLAGCDLVLDGLPQDTHGELPAGAGYLVLPLLLRDVPPGEHTLAVRVSDAAGNPGQSAEVRITVLGSPPVQPGPYARAVRLLDRLAFGPEPGELAELLLEGEASWLEHSCGGREVGDRIAREFTDALHGDRIAYDAGRLALTYALRTDDPLRARAVLFVDNHFSTWAGKTGAPAEWGEFREWMRLGPAPFPELLCASLTSPTMLAYLDQEQSYAGRLNENYARELLELHSVGVEGGYGQEEVTRLAWMLTGLTVANEAPPSGSGAYQTRVLRYDPELSDGRSATLLGWSFGERASDERYARLGEVLELLGTHPSTARFLCRKLIESTVVCPAPEGLLGDLVRVFRSSGGDLRELLIALAQHPAFWEESREPRFARPLEYGLRLARTCGVPETSYSLDGFLRSSGMGMFERETPDGYPADEASWADTNGLLQRWRWAQEIPWAVRRLVPEEARRYRGGDPVAWAQRVVDQAAVRLTGRTLGPDSNHAAVEFLTADDGPIRQRVDRTAQLLCGMPEASLE